MFGEGAGGGRGFLPNLDVDPPKRTTATPPPPPGGGGGGGDGATSFFFLSFSLTGILIERGGAGGGGLGAGVGGGLVLDPGCLGLGLALALATAPAPGGAGGGGSPPDVTAGTSGFGAVFKQYPQNGFPRVLRFGEARSPRYTSKTGPSGLCIRFGWRIRKRLACGVSGTPASCYSEHR